jgi:hypothetical protein
MVGQVGIDIVTFAAFWSVYYENLIGEVLQRKKDLSG